MAFISRPERKQKVDHTGKLLTLGGMIAGGAIGGPAGVAAGGSLGGLAGSFAEKPPEPEGPQNVGGAMGRRQQSLDTGNLGQIRQSIAAAQQLPDPKMRQEVLDPLIQAHIKAAGGQA